jgi:predicted Zn-ribbon and HTH transcriptional regulator
MFETVFHSGGHAIAGIFTCTKCGFKLVKDNHDILPKCPRCNNHEYTRMNNK